MEWGHDEHPILLNQDILGLIFPCLTLWEATRCALVCRAWSQCFRRCSSSGTHGAFKPQLFVGCSMVGLSLLQACSLSMQAKVEWHVHKLWRGPCAMHSMQTGLRAPWSHALPKPFLSFCACMQKAVVMELTGLTFDAASCHQSPTPSEAQARVLGVSRSTQQRKGRSWLTSICVHKGRVYW